jgi:hypothetical protein
MLKIAVAQTLDHFAIATQEPCKPKAGGSNDWYETMRPRPKSCDPKAAIQELRSKSYDL